MLVRLPILVLGLGFFGHECGVVVTWHAASLGLVLGYLLGCRLVLMG